MFNFKKKSKSIELFVVTPNFPNPTKDFDLSKIIFYTITETQKQSEEYVNRRLYLENKEHFTRWCELRELDYKDNNNWELYAKSTENIPFHKFSISKVTYKLNDVATIFRMFNGCIPIGTTYEDSTEVIQFMQNLPKESLDKIEQNLKEAFKDTK
jgi:hypothetical protein